MQFITRKTNLSCGHRVMNERMLCHNLHGHEYITHLTFSFTDTENIGYAIDFKEIKRVFIQFLQEKMDHGMLLNPKDVKVIETCKALKSRVWLMSLNGEGDYCNPSVENVAKEIFLSMEILSEVLYGEVNTGLNIYDVTVYETPNCWTNCLAKSIRPQERENFRKVRYEELKQYALNKGIVEYDDRKI